MTQQQMLALLVRAAKTFLQAFLAFIAAGLLNVVDMQSAKALGVAGLAAAISAVMNLFVKPAEAK